MEKFVLWLALNQAVCQSIRCGLAAFPAEAASQACIDSHATLPSGPQGWSRMAFRDLRVRSLRFVGRKVGRLPTASRSEREASAFQSCEIRA
jgi:hypothetical protein